MEFELSKIDAAVDQIDWAIRLFLDHQAYLPAITLAGAAEEILGKPSVTGLPLPSSKRPSLAGSISPRKSFPSSI
jgi:hypothetical protein